MANNERGAVVAVAYIRKVPKMRFRVLYRPVRCILLLKEFCSAILILVRCNHQIYPAMRKQAASR